jgi:two-component system chemotaxis sensor kinase CheA
LIAPRPGGVGGLRGTPKTRRLLGLGLRSKLTISHLGVGVVISLLVLFTTHWLKQRDTQIDGIRGETVLGATQLASTVNSAFEEGFSSIVLGELDDRANFNQRLDDLRARQRLLLARSDVTPDEARALRELDGLTAAAQRDASAMFASCDREGGHPNAAIASAFDQSMDRLRDHCYAIAALVSKRAAADDDLSRDVFDWAMLGIGLAASLLALGLGRMLGGGLAKPILNLRDATRAFARGETLQIQVRGDDEIGELAAAFAQTAESVQRLVAELTRRNADNRLLLDNVGQGLLTIDGAGRISPEHSAAVDRWFGPPSAMEPLDVFLGRIDSTFAAAARVGFEQVVAGILPTECTLPQMPRRLEAGGRHYQFGYEAIGAADAPARFLVVVTDVTSAVQRDVAEREGREMLMLFQRMLADRSGVRGFLEEASSLMGVVRAAAEDDLGPAMRALHTLKGNSAVFGLESIASLCHELESSLEERRGQPVRAEIDRLSSAWERVTKAIELIVGETGEVVEMSLEEHRALLRAVRDGVPRATIERLLLDVVLEPTSRPLRRFAEQAHAVAARLGKSIDVFIEDHGLRVDATRWDEFWAAFIHAVRNAVDHGIEAPKVREEQGKPSSGRLWLRTRIDGPAFVVEIEDDGRGIDFEAVRIKCQGAGRATESAADLLRALISGGISTASEITELSGRGVGLSALADACEHLGGRMEIETRRAGGMLLRVVFPVASMFSLPGKARPDEDHHPNANVGSTLPDRGDGPDALWSRSDDLQGLTT